MLSIVRADTMLATLGEAMASTLASSRKIAAQEVQIYWDIANNTFLCNALDGCATSISELLAGARTGRVRRRARNAKTIWERKKADASHT